MKQTITFFCFFFCFFALATAQCNDKWRAGSAYALQGKTYVLTVFVSEKEWDYAEKMTLWNNIYEAQNWLVAQAQQYHQPLSFEGGNFGLEKTILLDYIPVGQATGDEPTNWVDVVLKKIGYSSNLAFLHWVKHHTDCTNALVLIIANQEGTGYAMSYSQEMDKEKYFLESCLLYKNYPNHIALTSSSIAHELLHLFGAWDLYETFEQSKDRETYARSLFPNDIMHRTSFNINELQIAPLTAWLVGLSAYQENWYEWFRPSGR
ncbi:MAG: hypothetical protein ACKVTZ_12140 [Bacteroidia bacterium]